MQLLYKDVRFEVQTYTDKGSTNRIKNRYNLSDKFIKESAYLIHPSTYEKPFLKGFN